MKFRPPTRQVAWHEGGHATVALHHPDIGSSTLEVCVLPTDVVGYIQLDEPTSRQMSDEKFLRAHICTCLGGFVSDKLSGEVTEISHYGSDMSKVYEAAERVAKLKLKTNLDIGSVVAQILAEEFLKAQQIITELNRDLHRLVDNLVTKGRMVFVLRGDAWHIQHQ